MRNILKLDNSIINMDTIIQVAVDPTDPTRTVMYGTGLEIKIPRPYEEIKELIYQLNADRYKHEVEWYMVNKQQRVVEQDRAIEKVAAAFNTHNH